ncbi:MAG: hypothetical protein Q9159_000979 [Coniocarpon cinnabarinum]
MALRTQGFAFITGAASGLGREIAFTFAERGAAGVVFADINEAGAISAAEESKEYATHFQYRSIACRIDVTDEHSVSACVALAVEEFRRIDYAVHCAGVRSQLVHPALPQIRDVDIASLDAIHAVNAKGTLLITKEMIKIMAAQDEGMVGGRNGKRGVGRGAIVNLSSLAGVMPWNGHVQYCAAKAAAVSITQCAASENARNGIRVNALCPFATDTPMMQADFERKPESRAFVDKMSPMGRIAKPEEVAEVAWFLCAPAASYVNGLAMPIDAGISILRN